jgi:hypothetical protein
MATIVLFDDERSFIPGFRDSALVVRTVQEAEELFSTLTAIDELWLDYVLTPGDTTEALHALKGVEVKRVIFHSSAWMARDLVEYHLAKAGIATPVELPDDYSVLIQK